MDSDEAETKMRTLLLNQDIELIFPLPKISMQLVEAEKEPYRPYATKYGSIARVKNPHLLLSI